MKNFLLKIVGHYNDKNDFHIFNIFILSVIIFNAVILGMETMHDSNESLKIYMQLNAICLYIFTAEMLIKLYTWRLDFFKNGWNIFDLLIVVVCMIPVPTISILRALRVLRIFRILSSFKNTRRIVSALLNAFLPISSVIFLLFLFFYIYSILCFYLFSDNFPIYFGSLGKSMFSLFQVMTFEAWSESIVRPIMQIYPYSWIIFISFIFITSFIVLNLVVGIIVTSIQDETVDSRQDKQINYICDEIRRVEDELKELKNLLKQNNKS